MNMKKLLYSISVALLLVTGLASCSSDSHDLGASRVIGEALSWNITTVDDNNYTFTNTSQDIEGVTYYITLDGRTSKEFPIGATESISLKKNGFYQVSLYAISRGDQKSLSWTKLVDWFDENAKDPQWLGFTDGNLLAGIEAGNAHTWYADGSWSEVPNTTLDGSLATGYTFTHTANGGSQWQAQVQLEDIPLTLSAGKTYDFSIAIISTADSEGDGVTVKPQMQGDDNTFFSDARHPIHRGVNVITLTDQPGFDGNFKLAMDFAGLPEGTEIELRNIYVGEHNAANGGSADTWAFNFQSSDNLLKDATFTPSYWIADDGWNTLIENFEGFEGTSGEFVFTAPEGLGHSQWQGQAHIKYDVTLSAAKQYDFSLVLLSDADAEGVTVKPHPDGDDNTFFSDDRHALKAGVPTAVTLPACAGFDGTFILTLDFAGTPANAQVRVLGVYLGEHK